ncbi:VOC family protein [Alphaproteobacteria bacterium]|nr:VOC family protein [Alphaproteobacteria bacterium]
MSEAMIEHLNVTVNNPAKTAQMLVDIFGWKIRWQGEAIHEGYTIHVGSENSYLAVYGLNKENPSYDSYRHVAGLNHIGITVDDLDATEQRVIAAGFKPNSHGDYEPGRRFYFDDHDGIEFEVVSYSS